MNILKKIKWALFENADESLREGYTPLAWWLRNPFHNLTHYVPPFGFKNKDIVWHTPGGVWAPEGGFRVNWGHYKWWPLFVISYSGKIEFYFGHRCPEGVWGLAFRRGN